MRYDEKTPRIRGRRLQARRLRVWSASPFCASCGVLTEYPSGFELDHKQALFKGGPDTDENCQVLCHVCHARKSAEDEGYSIHGVFYPEWLKPIPSLTIVFGPPGAGKSSYVRASMREFDKVIDLDEIKAHISGKPLYQGGDEWLRRAAAVRNRMLLSLAKPGQSHAWLVLTGKGKASRDWWTGKLDPKEVKVMYTPIDQCISNIQHDERRPPEVKGMHIKAAKAWWDAEVRPCKREERLSFDEKGNPIW